MQCTMFDIDSEEEILKCLEGDSALLAKFHKFKKDRLLLLDPNTRFCVTPDCEGYMTGNRFRPKMECPICHVHVCFNCNQPWHGYIRGCNSSVDVGYSMWALNKGMLYMCVCGSKCVSRCLI